MHKACTSNKVCLGNRKLTQVFPAVQDSSSHGRLFNGLVCREGEKKIPQIYNQIVRPYSPIAYYFGATDQISAFISSLLLCQHLNSK